MKKNMLIIAGGVLLLLTTGCGSSKPAVVPATTGTITSGGVLVTGQDSLLQEITGSTITGRFGVDTGTIGGGTPPAPEISGLLEERATQPVATGKLNESDIDLIEKVIQKIEGLSK